MIAASKSDAEEPRLEEAKDRLVKLIDEDKKEKGLPSYETLKRHEEYRQDRLKRDGEDSIVSLLPADCTFFLVTKVLRRNGVKTTWDLSVLSDEALLKMRDLGPVKFPFAKAMRDVVKAEIREAGITLK